VVAPRSSNGQQSGLLALDPSREGRRSSHSGFRDYSIFPSPATAEEPACLAAACGGPNTELGDSGCDRLGSSRLAHASRVVVTGDALSVDPSI